MPSADAIVTMIEDNNAPLRQVHEKKRHRLSFKRFHVSGHKEKSICVCGGVCGWGGSELIQESDNFK